MKNLQYIPLTFGEKISEFIYNITTRGPFYCDLYPVCNNWDQWLNTRLDSNVSIKPISFNLIWIGNTVISVNTDSLSFTGYLQLFKKLDGDLVLPTRKHPYLARAKTRRKLLRKIKETFSEHEYKILSDFNYSLEITKKEMERMVKENV